MGHVFVFNDWWSDAATFRLRRLKNAATDLGLHWFPKSFSLGRYTLKD